MAENILQVMLFNITLAITAMLSLVGYFIIIIIILDCAGSSHS